MSTSHHIEYSIDLLFWLVSSFEWKMEWSRLFEFEIERMGSKFLQCTIHKQQFVNSIVLFIGTHIEKKSKVSALDIWNLHQVFSHKHKLTITDANFGDVSAIMQKHMCQRAITLNIQLTYCFGLSPHQPSASTSKSLTLLYMLLHHAITFICTWCKMYGTPLLGMNGWHLGIWFFVVRDSNGCWCRG